MNSRRFFAPLAVAALLAGAALPVSSPVLAQGASQGANQEPSPSHMAVARELVGLVGAASSADEIIPALIQDIKQQNVTRPELTKDLDEVLKILAPELELQRQQAINIAARGYAKFFTEAELKEVVAFYKTPTGTKFAKLQPDLVEEIIRGLGDWSQQVAEYMMTRVRVEMTKRGHTMQ